MSWDGDFDGNEPWREGFTTAAEERRSFVFTTFRGRRFHSDSNCEALEAGRGLSWNRYEVRVRRPEDAARAGYTACRVCVPPLLALPAAGETHGHEPVLGFLADRAGERLVCARCETADVRSYWLDDAETVLRRWTCRSAVAWPCTSALVLGLAPRPLHCPDCGTPMDPPPPGSHKCPDCDQIATDGAPVQKATEKGATT